MPAPPPAAGGSQPPSRPRRRTTQPPSSPSQPHYHTPSTPSGLRQSRTASSDSDPATSPPDHVDHSGNESNYESNNEAKSASPHPQQTPESSIPRSDHQPRDPSLPQAQDPRTTGLGLSHSQASLPHPDSSAPNPAREVETSSRTGSRWSFHQHPETLEAGFLQSDQEQKDGNVKRLGSAARNRVLVVYVPLVLHSMSNVDASISVVMAYRRPHRCHHHGLHVSTHGSFLRREPRPRCPYWRPIRFCFQPFLYALLGSCPQMVVGPEAAGSLLIGSIVKANIDGGKGEDGNAILHSKIAGVAVGLAGASVFIMGLGRFGFVDNVLSRPFLRGFISSIGVVIFIDQLTPVLGLSKVAASIPNVPHHTTVDKFVFIVTHLGQWHQLSGVIGIVSFVIIMVLREIKRRLQPRYPSVAYFPDRLIVVVLSAFLAYFLGWEGKGVEVLGKVEAPSGRVFTFRNPFQLSHLPHIREALGTSFLIGMLGFFESSVAAKSLGDTDTIDGMQLSPNRELIALGTANVVGACFMALPAFGGYGRSKVNKSTGGRTPMSSIFVSIITIICILYLLPWFYYLPKPVLSALIMVVAYSLIEEIPEDLFFFVKIKGWKELSLMAVIVFVTVLFSLNLGIAIGIGLSLLEVVRHATRPRIQILGRVPNSDRFANAEEHPEQVEFIEGCLIVKIPEPLTFANTGDLKSRLRRIERYGTNMAHPALPRLRPQRSNRNIIFDIHGVTSMDGSGTQVLEEIVRKYRQQGVRVFFSRAPNRNHKVWKLLEWSGIVALVGGEHLFVDDIRDALRMAESTHIDVPRHEADYGATSAA
ncbi:hypothetical protein RRF57_009404 [Xylaria bambusicola]|uniref:STAS domain-containing protein n=1 Tax=Xylaria bambusicola TaxID=326684 RepID=A0AAN7UJK5_9PEZI